MTYQSKSVEKSGDFLTPFLIPFPTFSLKWGIRSSNEGLPKKALGTGTGLPRRKCLRKVRKERKK